VVRAQRGFRRSSEGSYPVATAASLPASRYPRWRQNLRMTAPTDLLATAAMSAAVGGSPVTKRGLAAPSGSLPGGPTLEARKPNTYKGLQEIT